MPLSIEYPDPLLAQAKKPEEALAFQLARHLHTYMRNRSGKQTVLFLSGGSSLVMLDPLAKLIEEDLTLNVSQFVIGVVDERFDEQNSTYKTITKNHSKFYFTLANRGGSFMDTSPNLSSLEEMADWYNTKVQYYIEKIQTSDSGEMLAVLGMGVDGHIGGIFPYPEKKEWFDTTFVSTKRYVVGYDATGKNEIPKRFTLTYPALNTMTRLCAFITGDTKKEKLTEALTGEKSLAELPALYLQSAADRLVLFTDIRDESFGASVSLGKA